MGKTFVNIHELSERTGLPVAWLKTEATAGRLPFIRTGRRLMFHFETVERTLLATASSPSPEAMEGAAS